MGRFLIPEKFRRLVLTVSVLICLAVFLVLLLRPSTPAPFLILQPPFSRPLLLRDRIGSLLPWPAVWRVEDALFGKRKPVNFFASVVSLSDPAITDLGSTLALGNPTFADPTGLQVWLLGTADIQSVRQRFKQTSGVDCLNNPRISTADGVGASLFTGESIVLKGITNDIGLKVNCFPRVRSNSTDLFAMITLSEVFTNQTVVAGALFTTNSVSIRTNLDIAVRLQIPKGSGVLLIKASRDSSTRKTFGVILDPP
jgi:hypothetical protein